MIKSSFNKLLYLRIGFKWRWANLFEDKYCRSDIKHKLIK